MAEPSDSASLEEQVVAWAQRFYPWHRFLFVAFNVVLTAINFYTGKPWWALWPLVITGGLFTLHYLVYKTSLVDESWVDERANDLYDRSYDQGHIDSIAEYHDMETPIQRTERELRERSDRRKAARERRKAPDK